MPSLRIVHAGPRESRRIALRFNRWVPAFHLELAPETLRKGSGELGTYQGRHALIAVQLDNEYVNVLVSAKPIIEDLRKVMDMPPKICPIHFVRYGNLPRGTEITFTKPPGSTTRQLQISQLGRLTIVLGDQVNRRIQDAT